MAFTVYMKWVLMGCWVLWLSTLVVTRVFIFHEAYLAHVSKVADERWLLRQCGDSDFYSNIRQHTDLCESVSLNARSSAILAALNEMAVNTYACGSKSCPAVFQGIFMRLGWQSLGVVALLFVFAPNMFVVLYNAVVGRYNTKYENDMMMRNERFGTCGAYYQDLQSVKTIDEMPPDSACTLLRNRKFNEVSTVPTNPFIHSTDTN
jgi:hypothetical protein